MRKLNLTLIASLLCCSALSAFWPEAADSALEIGVGYRNDNLKFETVADRNSRGSSSGYYDDYGYDYSGYYPSSEPSKTEFFPITSSVLDWKNLNIAFIEGRGKYVTCDNFYFRGGADYGWVCSGRNTDTDYEQLFEQPKVAFSKSTSRVHGHVYDFNIAAGYQIQLCEDNFTVAPLIGYSWKGQHLHDTHLKQRPLSGSDGSYSFASSSYSIPGLHSKYNTRWNGPFVGLDSEYLFNCNWSFMLNYEYHWGRYHAKAFWNLRPDMPNGFHHRTKSSYGHVVDVGFKNDFCECWTTSVHVGFQYFRADHGRDVTVIEADSRGDVRDRNIHSIGLRKVEWYSTSVSFDIGMVF